MPLISALVRCDYEARYTNKFQTLCLRPRPTEREGRGSARATAFVESTRELLRYLRNYEQIVPQTYGAECKGQKSRGFYPQGNEK